LPPPTPPCLVFLRSCFCFAGLFSLFWLPFALLLPEAPDDLFLDFVWFFFLRFCLGPKILGDLLLELAGFFLLELALGEVMMDLVGFLLFGDFYWHYPALQWASE
jgi:hypothetical protein